MDPSPSNPPSDLHDADGRAVESLPMDSKSLPAAGSRAPSALREGWLALGSALAYLVFWRIVSWIHWGDITTIAITTLLSLFLVILFTVRMARALSSIPALLIN